MFRNRHEAAEQLAERLAPYATEHPLILGIPRGGVPLAALIADELQGDLDVVLVHKLGAPTQPELAIGAVHESGVTDLTVVAEQVGASQEQIQAEQERQLQELQRRRQLYTPEQPPVDPAGRVVIVIDDGSATGATMMTALKVLKACQPKKLVAAIGVAPANTVASLRKLADEVVCLASPAAFYAVGQFFQDFTPVSDAQAIGIDQQRWPQTQGASETIPAGKNAGIIAIQFLVFW